MYKSKVLIAVSVISSVFCMNAQAKLYKWVDDKGTTHYGEIIPPEFANKERDSIDKSGLIEKRPEKANPDAIRAKQEAEKKRTIENQAVMEQKRRDNALLNTYSNEGEIDQARDRSMVLINARIDSNRMLLKSSQATLDGLKGEAETRAREGKKIPPSLTNDIAQTEARVARYAAELAKSEEELASVRMRFEKEKELYRRLRGATPNQ